MEPFWLPKFSQEDWEDLARILGKPLSDDERAAVESIAERYIIARHFACWDRAVNAQRGREHRGKVKAATALLSLIRDLGQLTRKWQGLGPAAWHAVQEYSVQMAAAPGGGFDFESFMTEAEIHARYLREFLDRPSGPNPFVGFVGRLCEVYERVTEKRATNAYPAASDDSNARVSPFVEFVAAVEKRLPEGAREFGDAKRPASRAMAIRRALKDYQHGGNLPADL